MFNPAIPTGACSYLNVFGTGCVVINVRPGSAEKSPAVSRATSSVGKMNMTTYFKRKHLAAWLLAGGAVAAAIAAAPVAQADQVFPAAGSESVGATVGDLKAQGFSVVINYLEGHPDVPLSECHVTGINNPSPPTADPSTVTVSVDVECPNER